MRSSVLFLTGFSVLLLVFLCLVLLARRRYRELRVGGIDVALRVPASDQGQTWHFGVAHYRGEEFAWYRVLSLRRGPNWVINRGSIDVATRREPTTAESYSMPAGSIVVTLTGPGKEYELAMGADALMGFLSWLESAPPGRSVPWAS